MKIYKYICTACGNIIESSVFQGMQSNCGKCKGRTTLIDAKKNEPSNYPVKE